MFPHLRSGFRRRGQSNPTSPVPDQQPSGSWDLPAVHEYPYTAQDTSPDPSIVSSVNRPLSSNSSHVAPTLPPITRVTSADPQPNFSPRDEDTSPDVRTASVRGRYDDDSAGFMGGVALQNYPQGFHEAPRRDNTAAHAVGNGASQSPRSRVPPPPINTEIPYQRPPPIPTLQTKAGSSFVTPTDLQQLSADTKGKRPSGTRLVSEPVLSLQTQPLDVPKGRRGLSSLAGRFRMKRKPTQPLSEHSPVSPRFPQDESPEYDPRIKGTIVHDFGTPKTKRTPQQPQMPPSQSATALGLINQDYSTTAFLDDQTTGWTDKYAQEIQTSQSPTGAADTVHFSPRMETHGTQTTHAGATSRLSLDKALPNDPLPLPASEEGNNASTQTSSATASPKVSRQGSSALPGSSPSSRTLRSRNVSGSDTTSRDSTVSALPKHMKSTSSRFSFDMIGAAKQEKLLEEKHRQRQVEKGTDDGTFPEKDRDERFDDMDDGDYDYDAMMDDDGLEERIPGVNADAEDDDYLEEEIPGVNGDYLEEDIPGVNADAEDDDYLEEENPGVNADAEEDDYVQAGFPDEEDPDNDQENFSGFEFQRSNPPSALASPLPVDMLPAPRDPFGRVIGFAMTDDASPGLAPALSPPPQCGPATGETLSDSFEGLGIQGLDGQQQAAYDEELWVGDESSQPAEMQVPAPTTNDDLYYDEGFVDDGLLDELNFEPEGPAFDESLFDLNDTDKYGRPIPGAFAHAKSMITAQQQASNRQSDETSRISAQSAISQSTAHTSLDASLQPVLPVVDMSKEDALDFLQQLERRSSVAPAAGADLAYQAALAEAAHIAAASGKFRRGSSPVPLAHLTITSPTDSSDSPPPSQSGNGIDQEGDLRVMEDDDDFDDAVIAEANADALASDSDGWYGQEFGFYSAPLSVPTHGHGHHGTSSLDSSPKPLSAENLFQYANGGFFGPSGGVVRSKSGRVVSREPNLTPITERSEYSNRNSMMSFGVPPVIGSASQLQSPGLAELAMMDDDANMSMSALLRLRTKAFGGSKASQASSPDGSPRSELGLAHRDETTTSPWAAGSSYGGHAGAHVRKNSAFSMWSNSDAESGAGSPTMTMSSPPAQHGQGQGMHGIAYQIPSDDRGLGSMARHLDGATTRWQPDPPPGLGPSPIFTTAGGQQMYTPTSPVLPPCSTFPPVPEEESVQTPYREETTVDGHPSAIDAEMAALYGFRDHASTGPAQAVDIVGATGMLLHTSPTSMNNNNDGPLSQTTMSPPNPSPTRAAARGLGHRHKGSADSISYVKEEDSGETRWVMERRRTAETGEVEILGREVVEGGRI